MSTTFGTYNPGDIIQDTHIEAFNTPINNLETGAAYYGADAGSTDAYVVTIPKPPTSGSGPTSLTAGMLVYFTANTANTGPATLNVNSLGAKTIKKKGNTDLQTGDISAGQIVAVIYDGTNYQWVEGSSTHTASDIVSGTFGTARIANSAVTYAKIQNVSATDKLLGRATAGAGVVEEIPLTAAGRALLDDANAAAQRTTLGLGLAATQDVSIGLCELRLTLESGVPVSTTNQSDKTTVYLTPYLGSRVCLWDGTAYQIVSTAQVSLSVTALSADTLYYLYAYLSGGSVVLEASTTSFATTNGIQHKSTDQTRRLVGLMRTHSNSGTRVHDHENYRNVCSWQNQVQKPLTFYYSGAWFPSAAATWLHWNNSASAFCSFVSCGRRLLEATAQLVARLTTDRWAEIAMSLGWSSGAPDSENSSAFAQSGGQTGYLDYFPLHAHYRRIPGFGYNTLHMLCYASNAGVVFSGSGGSGARCGMGGSIWV